jgi:hypothetical protein
MSLHLRLATAAALSLALLSGVARGAPATPPALSDNGFDARILDTTLPQATRLELFSHVIDLSNQGQVRAEDLAGTFYWQGAAIAGSPVARNLDLARTLLGNAAVHGDVRAMAKLAELELSANRLQQAMVWAQMYARYIDPRTHHRGIHARYQGAGSSYSADLVGRVLAAGGSVEGPVVKDVNAMVVRYDAPIQQGIDDFMAFRRSGDPRLITRPTGSVPKEYRSLNGVAEYMVQFDPAGAPVKVWLLASYPSPKLGDVLRPMLDYARANPVDAGSGPRYLRVSIPNNSPTFRGLRPVR